MIEPREFKRYSARTPLPPGYAVERVEDHWCWVRLADDSESCIHWNHWACWRGAWEHYRRCMSDGTFAS